MPASFGPDLGSDLTGIVRNASRPPNYRTNRARLKDLMYRFNPRVYCDELEDFNGAALYQDVVVPLIGTTGLNIQATTTDTIGYVRSPGGTLISAEYLGHTALTADDTNYLTFTLSNEFGAAAGTTAMLAASAANGTQATGGASLVADVPFALTLSATAASLNTAAGDILLFTATHHGTLANTVTIPLVRLRFSALPRNWVPRLVRTGLGGSVGVQANTEDGQVQSILAATSEAQTAGFDWGDQLTIPASRSPLFACYVQIPTAITTAQTFVAGLGTAFNATVTSMSKYCRFRLAASMALLVDIKDGTTTQNGVATGITLSAGTWYRLGIDMTNLGVIRFWVDDNDIGFATGGGIVASGGLGLASTAFALADVLQPHLYVQKASGTTTPSFLCDWVRPVWTRFPK